MSSNFKQLRRQDRLWWAIIAVYVLSATAAYSCYRGPLVSQFVLGHRAIGELEQLLGQEPTHPAGSTANDAFRQRLVARLRSLGLEVAEYPFFDGELQLVNVVARLPGVPSGRPIVLSTHYDSCLWGPGAGDAGQCVGALIVAAEQLTEMRPQHEVWFVFTDGEERSEITTWGLRGARALVELPEKPWGGTSPFVLNFDARGNRGAVLLYETDSRNLQSMRAAAKHLARPLVSNSLMVSVYDRLPNATDFTIYKQAGWGGWNFAVIAGAEVYHTPDDTLANLSPRTVEQYVQQAIHSIRALDSLSPSQLAAWRHSGSASFFDVWGLILLVYPAWCDWGLVAISVLLSALLLRKVRRYSSEQTQGKVKDIFRVLLLLAVQLFAVALAGYLLAGLLSLSGVLPRKFIWGGEWLAHLYTALAALWLATIARWSVRDVSTDAICTSLCAGGALLALILTLAASGGTYLVALPTIWLAVWGFLMPSFSGQHVLGACALPAVLLAPTYLLFIQALGPTAGLTLSGVAFLCLAPTLLAYPRLPS